MINIALLKNPFNWLIVILMLAIAGIAATMLCNLFNGDEHAKTVE